jgi:hypothetical protein
MADTLEALILDLLQWISPDKSYAEVMDAWRTSCPKLPIWEEANERGFVVRERADGRGAIVRLTGSGRAFLEQHRRGAKPTASRAF